MHTAQFTPGIEHQQVRNADIQLITLGPDAVQIDQHHNIFRQPFPQLLGHLLMFGRCCYWHIGDPEHR